MDGIHRDCGFQAKENTGTGVSSKRKWILRRQETHSSSRNVHRSWALREGHESGPECPPLPLLLFHRLSFVDLPFSAQHLALCALPQTPRDHTLTASSPLPTLHSNSKLPGKGFDCPGLAQVAPDPASCNLGSPGVRPGQHPLVWNNEERTAPQKRSTSSTDLTVSPSMAPMSAPPFSLGPAALLSPVPNLGPFTHSLNLRILSSSAFCSAQTFSRLDGGSHSWGSAICFPPFTDSNVNLIQELPRKHTQK